MRDNGRSKSVRFVIKKTPSKIRGEKQTSKTTNLTRSQLKWQQKNRTLRRISTQNNLATNDGHL
jgi:hypothetical protein